MHALLRKKQIKYTICVLAGIIVITASLFIGDTLLHKNNAKAASFPATAKAMLQLDDPTALLGEKRKQKIEEGKNSISKNTFEECKNFVFS